MSDASSTAKVQLQTAHGRAQRRVLLLGWGVFFGVSAALVLGDVGTIAWSTVAYGVAAVAVAFVYAALRRERLGLYAERGELAVGRLFGRSRVRGRPTDLLRIVSQSDFEYVQAQRKPGRWIRIPYFTHVRRSTLLRFLYPQENAVLMWTPDGWTPIGVTWEDDAGAALLQLLEEHLRGVAGDGSLWS